MNKLKIYLTLFVLGYIYFICFNFIFDNQKVDITKDLISQLTAKNRVNNWPRLGPLSDWDISIDTFTDEVSSDSIEELYEITCARLEKLYPEKITTYYWEDEMGYPRLATIVEFKNTYYGNLYLITEAYENNDNDSYHFAYRKGVFKTENKKLLKSWKVKKQLLRCNYQN